MFDLLCVLCSKSAPTKSHIVYLSYEATLYNRFPPRVPFRYNGRIILEYNAYLYISLRRTVCNPREQPLAALTGEQPLGNGPSLQQLLLGTTLPGPLYKDRHPPSTRPSGYHSVMRGFPGLSTGRPSPLSPLHTFCSSP